MKLLELVHSMSPWVVLVPLGLFFLAYLIEELDPFKKPQEEIEEEELEAKAKRAEAIKLIKNYGNTRKSD
jgi:hypothetical protein